jgi:iron complex transport system ATP-binding protein
MKASGNGLIKMSVAAKDVVFAYGSDPVLRKISFMLGPSEMLGIIGPNGSGKTTLLKCINRILTPRQGRILIDNRDLSRMKRLEIARQIGYVPQISDTNNGSPTVFEVVMMGRRPHASWNAGKRDEEKTWNILASLKLERFAMNHLDELSGGERQKVMIARAMAQEARTMLLDEPTSSLDIKHQMEVMDLLQDLVKRKGLSAVTVVHDLDLAMKYCDRTVLMNNGRVHSSGNTEDVITPENIRYVYGVDILIERFNGRHHVLVA